MYKEIDEDNWEAGETDFMDGCRSVNPPLKEWNILELRVPQLKGTIRWALEPQNWITKLLCRYLSYSISIDYIQAIWDKEVI